MSTDNTLILAHYYTNPEIQQMADFVGDSLALIQEAIKQKPKRLVFAGVKFMSETAKIMMPDVEVIQPNIESTCSLVTQTDINQLRKWREDNPQAEHVMYINSSAEMKALADIIVTSANVVDVVNDIQSQGKDILFSPDRNMGSYLNHEFNLNMEVWSSVCEVHDAFTEDRVKATMRGWTDGPKYLIAHPESPLPVLKMANMVGSTSNMLKWVEQFKGTVGTIYVATESGLLYNMREIRPELDIRELTGYTGCACSSCPYMKLNTQDLIKAAINGKAGTKIDYLSNQVIEQAYKPIKRMLEFSK